MADLQRGVGEVVEIDPKYKNQLKLRGGDRWLRYTKKEHRQEGLFDLPQVGDTVSIGCTTDVNGQVWINEMTVKGREEPLFPDQPTSPDEIPFQQNSEPVMVQPIEREPVPQRESVPMPVPPEQGGHRDTSKDAQIRKAVHIKAAVDLAVSWQFKTFDDRVQAALFAFDLIEDHVK
jgi:hypothetical protein